MEKIRPESGDNILEDPYGCENPEVGQHPAFQVCLVPNEETKAHHDALKVRNFVPIVKHKVTVPVIVKIKLVITSGILLIKLIEA